MVSATKWKPKIQNNSIFSNLKLIKQIKNL